MAEAEQDAFCLEQYRPLVGALGLYTGDAALAEELAQEALARALLHWDRVAKARSPGAYVHRVAMNLANSHFRRRRAAGRALARHGPGEEVHRDPPVADVLAVRQAVGQLPRRQRQIVVLRYRSELSFAEIAEVLGMTVGAAKALHHRAAGRLRRLLAPEQEHTDVG